jgi:hypothetical protein
MGSGADRRHLRHRLRGVPVPPVSLLGVLLIILIVLLLVGYR